MDPFADLLGSSTSSAPNAFTAHPNLPSPAYGNKNINQRGYPAAPGAHHHTHSKGNNGGANPLSNETSQLKLKQQLQAANNTITVLRQQLVDANVEISMLKVPGGAGRSRTTSALMRRVSLLANNQYYTTEEKDMIKLQISKGDESIIALLSSFAEEGDAPDANLIQMIRTNLRGVLTISSRKSTKKIDLFANFASSPKSKSFRDSWDRSSSAAFTDPFKNDFNSGEQVDGDGGEDWWTSPATSTSAGKPSTTSKTNKAVIKKRDEEDDEIESEGEEEDVETESEEDESETVKYEETKEKDYGDTKTLSWPPTAKYSTPAVLESYQKRNELIRVDDGSLLQQMYWKRRGIRTMLNRKYKQRLFVFRKHVISVYPDESSWSSGKGRLDIVRIHPWMTVAPIKIEEHNCMRIFQVKVLGNYEDDMLHCLSYYEKPRQLDDFPLEYQPPGNKHDLASYTLFKFGSTDQESLELWVRGIKQAIEHKQVILEENIAKIQEKLRKRELCFFPGVASGVYSLVEKME